MPATKLNANATRTCTPNSYKNAWRKNWRGKQQRINAKAEISRGLPIIRPFDASRFSPLAYHPIVLAPHDQVFLLTRLTLNSTRLINTLLVQLQKQPSASLNIYFADHPSPQAVRAWVAKAGLRCSGFTHTD